MNPTARLLSMTLSALALGCDAPEDTLVSSRIERSPGVNQAAPRGTSGDPVSPEEPVDPDPVGPADPVEPEPVEPDPTEPDPVEPDPAELTSCPRGVVCVDAFPFFAEGDTTLGPSAIDAYGCAPGTDESGPEIAYRVELPTEGLLVATLDGVPDGVDVDVHVLSAGAAPDPSRCLNRGHWSAAAFLPAGSAWVIVDSWVGDGFPLAGPYSLTLGFTAAADFESQDLDAEVLGTALKVFDRAWRSGDTERLEYTIIDFSLHSIHPRLWTLDLSDGSLLFKQRVSHGEGSADAGDPGWAVAFSNIEGSHQSSLGLMRTAARYMSSSNGLSLRLDGLEDGINDEVRPRAIVIHSDAYAADSYAESHGRMGLSWGCQVIDPDAIELFVDTVEGGALVWSWYPDDDLQALSTYL